jgi:hypothetical protein
MGPPGTPNPRVPMAEANEPQDAKEKNQTAEQAVVPADRPGSTRERSRARWRATASRSAPTWLVRVRRHEKEDKEGIIII